MPKTFRLSYTMTCDLTAEQIWPDGDGPRRPKPADVEKAIRSAGGWVAVLKDWDLGLHGGHGEVAEVEP
jgi:hypothetical protein